MPQSFGRIKGEFKEMLPLGSRVVIRPHQIATYAGKIFIPEQAKSAIPTTGTIVALGFDLQDNERNRLKVGDNVAFSKYGGIEFKTDTDVVFLVVHEEDIVAIIQGASISISEETN